DEVAYLAQTFDRVTARLRLATRQQELLRSLAGALNQHVDLQPMLQEACPVLQELLGAEAVWIYVLEELDFTQLFGVWLQLLVAILLDMLDQVGHISHGVGGHNLNQELCV
ncbi:MAG: hypothetical protein ABIN58_13305, partial [candidate division WOR-3 bacterium]